MKILLISSGYSGIYPYFEKAIEEAFILLDHQVIKINPEYTAAAVEIIERYKPDIIMTMVGYKMDQKLMEFLKKINSIRCIWLTEDPFYIDMSLHLVRDYHYIFTIDLGAFEYFKKRFPQKNIYHLPLGTDPVLYYPIEPKEEYLYDVCLVGFPYPERIELINQLLKHTQYSLIVVGPFWKKNIVNHKQNRSLTIINKWMEPEWIRNQFNCSKIILNPHRSYKFSKNINTLEIENKSINNRTFDIAACGGFQLLSNKPDLEMHFETQDMVAYSCLEECIDLVNHYVNDEASRDEYRKNALKRVMESHTFAHRVEFILKILRFNNSQNQSSEKFNK
jgi:spore maturation protein CgeB